MTINAAAKAATLVPLPDDSLSSAAPAGNSFIWSTSYDIATDWFTSTGTQTGIPGMTLALNQTTAAGAQESIITAAQRSGSPGPRGQRHYNGPANAGANDYSGGTQITLSQGYPELWFRWYMRYQLGYFYNPLSYEKWLIFVDNAGGFTIPEWHNNGPTEYANVFSIGQNYDGTAGKGFQYLNGGATGDGNWHLFEVHLKIVTVGAANGIGQIWLDEELVCDRNTIQYGAAAASWAVIEVASNASTITSAGDQYVDYDDIAVSTIGYIGPAA